MSETDVEHFKKKLYTLLKAFTAKKKTECYICNAQICFGQNSNNCLILKILGLTLSIRCKVFFQTRKLRPLIITLQLKLAM